jgi:hypothetical protein
MERSEKIVQAHEMTEVFFTETANLKLWFQVRGSLYKIYFISMLITVQTR